MHHTFINHVPFFFSCKLQFIFKLTSTPYYFRRKTPDNGATLFFRSRRLFFFQRQLEQFFIAYEVTNDQRRAAILLTAISPDVFRTLTNICFPAEPSAKTFKQLCYQLQAHFSPIVSIFAEITISKLAVTRPSNVPNATLSVTLLLYVEKQQLFKRRKR